MNHENCQKLTALLLQYGNVLKTGKSRENGLFVRYRTQEQVDAAVKGLNNTLV